jgi:hypothetical protein
VEDGAELVVHERHRPERLLVGREHHRSDVELAVEDERLDVVGALLAQLEDDARVRVVELGEEGREERDADDGRHADPQPPAPERRELHHLLLHHAHRIEDPLGALEHHAARVGQGDAPPLPEEQRRPELLLERPDRLAHRRLGHVERLARAGEALAPGDLDEVPQGLDVHGPSFPHIELHSNR